MNRQFLVASLVLALIFGAFVFLYGENRQIQPALTTVPVTASFYPMYFFTKEIGGSFVTASNITPPGAEPHEYEPTTQDITSISQSKALILNGTVEVWGEKITKLVEGTGVSVVVAGDGLQSQNMEEDKKTEPDPHVWLDPLLAKVEVERIAEALMTLDPVHAREYQENRDILLDRLDRLHVQYVEGLLMCRSRDIITSHSAFAYLASRYNLRQVSIAGLSPDQEPSAKELALVSDFAKKNNVHYIFFESLVSPKLAETIAKEVGAQVLVLNPLEGITDEEAVAGRDYFSVMQDNLKNLQIALQCKM